MQVNAAQCKNVGNQLLIAVDGDTMQEVTSQAAAKLAEQFANEHGYGNGGQNNPPTTTPLTAEGVEFTPEQAFDPNMGPAAGYRATFSWVKRL